ncbi:MAG: DUF1631 family protein [Burkholderiaceae bacterium]
MPTESEIASSFSRDNSRLQQARTLMRSLTAQTHEIFSREHEEMLTRLRKHLFELADKSESPARATHWMSAYMLLDRQAEPFKRAHLAAVRTVLEEVCEAELKVQRSSGASKSSGFSTRSMSPSLSLVDMSEMDRTVLVDRVARPMNAAFDETLSPFTQRIGLLLGYEEPELAHNPFKPESFIRAFALGWENAKLDPHATEDLILALSPNSFFALGDLFDALNITLMKAGVAPQLKYRVKRARDIGVAGGGGASMGSGFSGASPASTQELPRSNSPAAAALQGSADEGPGFGDSILRIGLSAKDFLSKLSTRLQRPLFGEPGEPRGDVFPPTQPDPEFFNFLSDMQRSIDESPSVDMDARNVLRQIRDQQEVRRAPELDRGTVDALSEVFDYVFNDQSIPSQLKVIIGRLQIPVLKAAMLDREFFFKEDHPARKLVDALAKASVEWAPEKGDEDPLYIRIENTVQRVLSDFEEDLELFTELLQEFESFLFEHEQQVSARIEPQAFDAERNEQLDLGLRAADDVIHAKLEGRTVDPLLPPFLTTQWREVMGRAWLAREERPDVWERAEQTMDQLIWSTEPKTTAEDRRALVTMLPGMVRNLNVALDAIRWNGSPRAEFTKRLIETHTRVVRAGAAPQQDPERQQLEAQAAHQAIAELDDRRSAQLAGSEDEFDVMAHAMTRGLWLEFLTEEGSTRRYRLGWISPMRTRLLFTNREGFDAFVCSEREVAAWLRSGRLRVLETEAIVGRALGAIMQQGDNPASTH